MKGIVYLNHIRGMLNEVDVGKRLVETIENNVRTGIVYDYNNGSIMLNGQGYEIGKKSFSEIAKLVLGTLEELYGAYRTIPYTFNQETYENSIFKVDALALGGQGLLEFNIYRKQV